MSDSRRQVVPAPPRPFDPLEEAIAAGTPLERCHSDRFGPRDFNATDAPGRFRPLTAGGATVPTMYVAEHFAGALFETVLRDVPLSGSARRVSLAKLRRVVRSTIVPTRPIRLAALHGIGLGRLGVTHGELSSTDSIHYLQTVPWAEAVHADPRGFDGLAWRSRQNEDALIAMLFGDRVDPDADLETVRGPEPLGAGAALADALEVAEDAGITITVPG